MFTSIPIRSCEINGMMNLSIKWGLGKQRSFRSNIVYKGDITLLLLLQGFKFVILKKEQNIT
jgi:hypothetical protein